MARNASRRAPVLETSLASAISSQLGHDLAKSVDPQLLADSIAQACKPHLAAAVVDDLQRAAASGPRRSLGHRLIHDLSESVSEGIVDRIFGSNDLSIAVDEDRIQEAVEEQVLERAADEIICDVTLNEDAINESVAEAVAEAVVERLPHYPDNHNSLICLAEGAINAAVADHVASVVVERLPTYQDGSPVAIDQPAITNTIAARLVDKAEAAFDATFLAALAQQTAQLFVPALQGQLAQLVRDEVQEQNEGVEERIALVRSGITRIARRQLYTAIVDVLECCVLDAASVDVVVPAALGPTRWRAALVGLMSLDRFDFGSTQPLQLVRWLGDHAELAPGADVKPNPRGSVQLLRDVAELSDDLADVRLAVVALEVMRVVTAAGDWAAFCDEALAAARDALEALEDAARPAKRVRLVGPSA